MKKKVLSLIYDAIDEVNSINNANLTKEYETELYGQNSNLDSLGLVNLIVSVEEGVNTEFNANISIADEKALSQKNSPFKSVKLLTEYIILLLKEN